MTTILLATYNQGKVERFRKLIKQASLEIETVTPDELGLPKLDVEENGATLLENATIKAKAFFGQTSFPILSNDTGFWVNGEGLVDAPKRISLAGRDEASLTLEEKAEAMLSFWKGIATKHGGQVDAAWVEWFVLLNPDGSLHSAESRREVTLTNQEFGKAHIQYPMRALYTSKVTNKPALEHTEAEEELEMQPVTNALKEVLSHTT